MKLENIPKTQGENRRLEYVPEEHIKYYVKPDNRHKKVKELIVRNGDGKLKREIVDYVLSELKLPEYNKTIIYNILEQPSLIFSTSLASNHEISVFVKVLGEKIGLKLCF